MAFVGRLRCRRDPCLSFPHVYLQTRTLLVLPPDTSQVHVRQGVLRCSGRIKCVSAATPLCVPAGRALGARLHAHQGSRHIASSQVNVSPGSSVDATLKIYGVGVSQPVRTLQWTCLMQGVPYNMIYSLPFGDKASTDDAERPRLDAKALHFPSWLRTVPTIDDNGFILSECAAILCYLADKHDWHSLYPRNLQTRARIHEYMHWHHASVRHASHSLFMPIVHPTCAPAADVLLHGKSIFEKSLTLLDANMASSGRAFLHGDEPTLSDLLCYGELGQLSSRFLGLYDFAEHGRVSEWLLRMEQLPKFDAAHEELREWIPKFQRMRGQKPDAVPFDVNTLTFWVGLREALRSRSPLYPVVAERVILAKQAGQLAQLRQHSSAAVEDVCFMFDQIAQQGASPDDWVNDFRRWWLSGTSAP